MRHRPLRDGAGIFKQESSVYYAGIDIGSVAAKALILEKRPGNEARIAGKAVLPTGWNSPEAGRLALEKACAEACVRQEEIARIVATGYGRISLPFADKSVTEVTCHARGAAHLYPRAGIIKCSAQNRIAKE